MPQPDYENDLAFPPRHDKTAYELQLENNKLRGLLKECVPYMDVYLIAWTAEAKDLFSRIKAAIDESEA